MMTDEELVEIEATPAEYGPATVLALVAEVRRLRDAGACSHPYGQVRARLDHTHGSGGSASMVLLHCVQCGEQWPDEYALHAALPKPPEGL